MVFFQSFHLNGFCFPIFPCTICITNITTSLLIKSLYLLGSIVLIGEEAAQREGGGAGHGDQQEGQEVSQHLHGVAGVVTVAIVSSGSDQAQLILFTDDHEMQRDIFILRCETSVFLVHVNISTLEL